MKLSNLSFKSVKSGCSGNLAAAAFCSIAAIAFSPTSQGYAESGSPTQSQNDAVLEYQNRQRLAESQFQQMGSDIANQQTQKVNEGEKSGAITMAGRVPLWIATVGSGAAFGRPVLWRASKETSVQFRAKLMSQEGELKVKNKDSTGQQYLETKVSSQPQVAIGRDFDAAETQTKVVYHPAQRKLSSIVGKQLDRNWSLQSERILSSGNDNTQLNEIQKQSLQLIYQISF